jgi:hypothetical protein
MTPLRGNIDTLSKQDYPFFRLDPVFFRLDLMDSTASGEVFLSKKYFDFKV